MAPRWRKVLKDLGSNKLRTLLVILTIGVGVFAVGYVSSAYSLIMHDMQADYLSVNPHSAIIYTTAFGEELLNALYDVEGVGQVQGRSTVAGNLLAPDGRKIGITIYGIPPVDKMSINRLRPARPGALPALGKHEIYIEHTALQGLALEPGDVVSVQIGQGLVRNLRVAAFVHDVNNVAYTFYQQINAYTTPETIGWLGGPSQFNEILISVAEGSTDEDHVRAVASRIADKVEASGRLVYFTLVYRPGRHFASDTLQALGAMLFFLGALAVFLSTFLVINTINALLAQQVRQIGVMKAVGARTAQLAGMYLALVMCFGLLSLLIAVPLAQYLAKFTASAVAVYLNFQPGEFRLLPVSLSLQAGVAVLVPLIAALVPVIRGARITVRDALSSYGLGKSRFGSSLLDRLVEWIRFLPRPVLISLRNTFRRKGRLLLTLSALVLAGGIFISVFNLRAAINETITQTYGYVLSDVNLVFNRPYRIQQLEPLALSVPGVISAEGWGSSLAEVLTADKTTSTQVAILAPPANSTLIDPTLTSGRWLLPEDENAIVIGNHLVALRPELNVGNEIAITIDGQQSSWVIVGVYRMAGAAVPPIVYANYEYLSRTLGQISRVSELRVITQKHDMLSQQLISRQLEDRFVAAGIQVNQTVIGADLIARNTSQTDILVNFMMVMAALIALVGGLGLSSTMSMNVIERTREIGVIRAIGASNWAIMQIVVVEGLTVGLLSWMLGAALAVPVGMLFTNVVGQAFFQSPMQFIFSMDGFITWLVVSALLSVIASSVPARGAARLTVREVLAYE